MNAKVIQSAVHFGVFTELAKHAKTGGLTCEQLRTAVGIHERGALDFFDALVALKFLERDAQGRYTNSEGSNMYLDKSKPAYMANAGTIEMSESRLYGHWGHLSAALKTGQQQNESKTPGVDVWESLYKNPVALANFANAMTAASTAPAQEMCNDKDINWEGFKSIVDIGVSSGIFITTVVGANPHLVGIGYDLVYLKPIFETNVKNSKLESKITFAAGDFFKDEKFPQTDVIVMGHILHDWDLVTKKMLIKKAYDSLANGGAFIVYERFIDNERRQIVGLTMSLNMLIETSGGFDYTQNDCIAWMKESGFTKFKHKNLACGDGYVMAIKESK